MIVVNLTGNLYQQLEKIALGLACMEITQRALRFSRSDNLELLQLLEQQGWIASEQEIADAQMVGMLDGSGPAYRAEFWQEIQATQVLAGEGYDVRYLAPGLPRLASLLSALDGVPLQTPAADTDMAAECIAVDVRHISELPGPRYFVDALLECQHRYPKCSIRLLGPAERFQHTLGHQNFAVDAFEIASFPSELQALVYFARCTGHVVSDLGFSYWAALIGAERGGLAIAPMQLQPLRSGDRQPVWPAHWRVMPPQIAAPATRLLDAAPLGSEFVKRPIRIGVTGCYEHIISNNYLFTNMQVANGHNSLKPWCDLYAYGQDHGLEFVTLDQVEDLGRDLDAVIVMDRQKPGNQLAEAAMMTDLLKILVIYECPLIKPDNWERAYHDRFDYVFTWNDDLVDGRRYIKNNFVSDCLSPFDFDLLKSAFAQRKLLTMINSYVMPNEPERFPTQLYTHRIRTIRWYESNQADDFDLFGMGWNAAQFPSYRGTARDKLAVLSHYRFAICYENAQSYPGYISEKLQDCLLAGVVPVYGGAPNVAAWIPSNCYIDISAFVNYADLHKFLSGMSEQEHGQYLDNIRTFLQTEKSYPFSTQCFIHTLTGYLVWGVQARREAKSDSLSTDYFRSHWLRQDKASLQLSVVAQEAIAKSPAVEPELTPRNVARNLVREDLIIATGYGPELPVFLRVRGIWQFYASHFPNIKIIFMRSTNQLKRGEIVSEGEDLLIGLGDDAERRQAAEHAKASGYAHQGVWSAIENENTIFRQVCLYDYLLRREKKPFRLYAPTITSIVDIRALATLMDYLPTENLFAGMPGVLRHAPYAGVGMVHGGNTLVSSDVMERMRDRYVAGHEYTQQPNDHWQGLILQDVPRIALPLFSFNAARDEEAPYDDIGQLVKALMNDGHYHFRVKTASTNPHKGRREDVDPWIMLKTAETILRNPCRPERVVDLFQRFGKCCDNTIKQPRDFPIDDSETHHFYRLEAGR